MKLHEKKEIGGRTYHTEMYQVEKSLRLETKIGRLIGGAGGRLAGMLDSDDELDGESLASALVGFFQELEALGGPEFYRDVLQDTMIIERDASGELHKRAINLNEDFRGRLVELKRVTIWVLRFNFEEYLGNAFGRVGDLKGLVAAKLGLVSLEASASA